MHELYHWPFANAARAKVAAFMCSYQHLNGFYACQNSTALNCLLKEELGFQGYVMSDWGGTHSGVASIQSGLDMNMPGGLGAYGTHPEAGSFFGGNVTRAVNNGTVDESRVDGSYSIHIRIHFFEALHDPTMAQTHIHHGSCKSTPPNACPHLLFPRDFAPILDSLETSLLVPLTLFLTPDAKFIISTGLLVPTRHP